MPSREQLVEICDWSGDWPGGGSCVVAGSQVQDAEGVCGPCLRYLVEQARNEALEEAALGIRNYFGDYDRQRIRALKSAGGA